MPAPTIPAECAMWSWLAMNAPEEMPETETCAGSTGKRPSGSAAQAPPPKQAAATSSGATNRYADLRDMTYRSGGRGRLRNRTVQHRLELVQCGHHSRLQNIGDFGAAARRHLRKDVRVRLIFEDRGLECFDLMADDRPDVRGRHRRGLAHRTAQRPLDDLGLALGEHTHPFEHFLLRLLDRLHIAHLDTHQIGKKTKAAADGLRSVNHD